MAVKACSLNIDGHNRERDNRGTPLFPCGGYTTALGAHGEQRIPWHWHEEAEVLVVCQGSMELGLVGRRFSLSQGEGAFINGGALQSATGECELLSLVFHPGLIGGMGESAIGQKYVRPLLECGEIPGVYLGKEVPWHREAVECIREAFSAYREEAFGYELVVRERLSRMWLLVAGNHRDSLRKQAPAHPDSTRLRQMLAYVHSHYMEEVELSQIAGAASISRRECMRCFKRTIGISPMQYLMKHRLSVAAGLLESPHMTVTQVSRESGFASPSYFAAMFKKHMEETPREYQKRMADG